MLKCGANGVTLIELLIALAVLGILLMVGVPSYTSWIQNSQIRAAAESISDGLQLARVEAIRRNSLVSFTLTGNDWSIDVVTPPENVQRRANSDTPRAVVAATQAAVTYNSLGRVVPVPAAQVTFNVTNPTAGTCRAAGGQMRCLEIVVQPTGEARLCDPALTDASNPQAC